MGWPTRQGWELQRRAQVEKWLGNTNRKEAVEQNGATGSSLAGPAQREARKVIGRDGFDPNDRLPF